MNSAVIDIGTNSIKLSVANLDQDIQILKEESRITRLGKDVDRDCNLCEDSIKATLLAIQDFVNEARSFDVQTIVAAGTSALRDARNGHLLTDAVLKSTGIAIEIISGAREAELAYAAVTRDPTIHVDGSQQTLVFDIGGGSTELILGDDRAITDRESLNIGALRLTGRSIHSDPPLGSEMNAVLSDASREIDGFFSGKSFGGNVIGVGGTATTLAALILRSKAVHGKSIETDAIAAEVERLAKLRLSERKKLEFLEPERAEMIVAGALILLTLLRTAKVSEFVVSLRGMRYGLLLEQQQAG